MAIVLAVYINVVCCDGLVNVVFTAGDKIVNVVFAVR